MRRLLNALPLALLVTIAAATPAQASLADWLDKLGELSGPGPFNNKGLGIALDIVCWEGPSWQHSAGVPQTGPAGAAAVAVLTATQVAAVERAMLAGLDAQANNPFEIAATIQAVKTGDAVRGGSVWKTYSSYTPAEKDAALAFLRERDSRLFWELRERVFANPSRADQETRLRQELKAFNINPDAPPLDFKEQVGLFTGSFKVIVNPFCVGDLRQPRRSLGVYAGWFTTTKIPSEYVYAPEALAKDPTISAVPVAMTFRMTVPGVTSSHPIFLRSHDIGLSAGTIIFSGDRLPRRNTELFLEIPRIAFRPLAAIACERPAGCPGNWTMWDLFEIELVGRVIPGFTAQDWGAVSGPPSNWHWLWGIRAGISIKFSRDDTPPQLVP